jgi:hypothetical protein
VQDAANPAAEPCENLQDIGIRGPIMDDNGQVTFGRHIKMGKQ